MILEETLEMFTMIISALEALTGMNVWDEKC